jgi:hypothetical protein
MHFSAKVIEDTNFYRYRRWYLILSYIPMFVFAYLLFMNGRPYLSSLVVLVQVLIYYWAMKHSKRTRGNSIIGISKQEITLSGKNSTHTIRLSELDSVAYSGKFGLPEENFREIKDAIVGKPHQQFLTLRWPDGREEKVHFMIESYYMSTQLMKILEQWRAAGKFNSPSPKAESLTPAAA